LKLDCIKWKLLACGTALVLCGAGVAYADGPMSLTLESARELALRNSPALQAAGFSARAAGRIVAENRAAYFPQLTADATSVAVDKADSIVDRNGVEQQLNSYITAGQLNTATLFNRTAAGVQLKQLVTDFGKTGSLVSGAKASYRAAQENLDTVRAKVVLDVTEAFFRTLQAQITVRIAQKTLEDRQLEAERIAVLAKNKLRSELDVSFANVALAQTQLLLVQAKNSFEASTAELAFTLGMNDPNAPHFDLQEASQIVDPPPADLSALIRQAGNSRPELARQRAVVEAEHSNVNAQRANNYPTLTVLGAAGNTFSGDSRLPEQYAAVGLNVSVPLFAGGLYSARTQEAQYRERSAQQQLQDLEGGVDRDVRVAWLNAQAGFEALSASEKLRSYAAKSLDLAQSRYRLGINSIIELNTAQLNAIDAEIQSVKARYEYQIDLARLAFQAGTL
jgi:outer membrane protein